MISFKEIADLFNTLEKTSKRLEKIMILRDFLEKYKSEGYFLFDLISGNLQKKINKKNLGISLKTIFSVLNFVSKISEIEIERLFNKYGDIGIVAEEVISKSKQISLINSNLTIEKVISSLKEIGNNKGNNSNKKKKEILSNLFLYAKSKNEYKFLARFLIDDLRIGVSEGVLRESAVNYLFPKIIGIQNYCSNCGYFTLNMSKCFKCSKKIEFNKKDLLKKYEIIEFGTPKEIIGLNEFIKEIDKDELDKIRILLRLNSKKYIIESKNENHNNRWIYNLFLKLFEKKYNLINNFEFIFKELESNLEKVIESEIKLFNPIKSMLGSRVNNISEAFEISKIPSLIDFKYDGLRVQIHNKFGNVKLFSRNLEDITKQFPEVVDFIKDNFSDSSFIIDSECIGFDFKNKKFLDFQILSRRIMSKNINEVSHINIIVKFFDIMYLNGKTLINEKYKIRRKIVEELILNRSLKQKLYFNIDELKSS